MLRYRFGAGSVKPSVDGGVAVDTVSGLRQTFVSTIVPTQQTFSTIYQQYQRSQPDDHNWLGDRRGYGYPPRQVSWVATPLTCNECGWRVTVRDLSAEARLVDKTGAVLLEGSVPQQFFDPPKAIASDCTAVIAVASSLDTHGVHYLRDLLSGAEPPDVKLVLLVHATCSTTQENLFDLLTLLDTNRLKVWVLAVESWGATLHMGTVRPT